MSSSYHYNHEWREEEEEDPYSSGDEQTTHHHNTSRLRRTDRNVLIVQTAISTPPPPWDPQNRSFTAALHTIRDDPMVKSHLERLEEIKTVSGDRVLADSMYTEVMAVIVHAARAVSLAGVRREGEAGEEFEGRMSVRARTTGGFCWVDGRHPSAGSTPEEGDAVQRPSTVSRAESRVGGERRVGGESTDYFSIKVRTSP